MGPTASVLSVGYAHGNVPELSPFLASGDPELLPGRDAPVLNLVMLAAGWT
jgi:hypothetical protein